MGVSEQWIYLAKEKADVLIVSAKDAREGLDAVSNT